MLYREIIAYCSQIHTKHINTLCGQKVELGNVKLAVGVFPGGKVRPGCDADPSPPSSAIGHERVELYLYSPYGPYGLYRAFVCTRMHFTLY